MIDSRDALRFARLAQKIVPGSMLLRVWPLHGGVSAQVTAMELQHADGQIQTLTVRQHGAADRARNPNIAADELRLLTALHATGVPAPKPYAVDASGVVFETPVIVVEYIEGESVFALDVVLNFIPQFAAQLAAIHQIDVASFESAFLPRQEDILTAKLRHRPARLDDSLEEERIRDALEAVWPPPSHNPSGLLHGDYWPGNILWRDGRLVGVIDWEDAAIGDPLADLANSRLELLWAFGMDAMQRFTQDYAAAMPQSLDLTHLPTWDLCAALRPAGRLSEWATDEAAETRMRERHHLFVTQAFAQLPGRPGR